MAEHGEESGGLVGCQDRGRGRPEIKIRAPVQELEDLNALLDAHRELHTFATGSTAKPVRSARDRQIVTGGFKIKHGPLTRAQPEDHVLDDLESTGTEHKVLVHHADAEIDRGARPCDGDRPSMNGNTTLFGLIKTVKAFINVVLPAPFSPRSVVNLALANTQGRTVIGHHPWKTLGDALHLDGWRKRLDHG